MYSKYFSLLLIAVFLRSLAYSITYEAEGWDDLIEQYAPIVYLHEEETALPIAVEDYFLHKETCLCDEEGNVLLKPGDVSMRKIYEMSLQEKKKKNGFYFDVSPTLYLDFDSSKDIDSSGTLRVPTYVLAYSALRDGKEKIYLHYVFFYAYNQPYNLRALNWFVSEEKRGGHIADVEHITIEVDEEEREIDRIFFAVHGREGVWFPANHEYLSYEEGHPVVFSAKGSHASYEREGRYVRGFGLINDLTSKGIRWVPKISSIFFEEDSRFNPDTMGWVYHRGTYAKDHVDAVCLKDWFGDPSKETGREIKDILFCKNDAIWERIKKTLKAKPP